VFRIFRRESVRSFLLSVCVLPLFLQFAHAGTVVTPSTTLSAETGKNTSAADSFAGEPNGNVAANVNVSKVPTSTLIYSGSTTKIYAHFMPWFGFGNHVDIGYKSTDPAEVKAQVTDMLSRGIAGMIIDWYGQGSNEDKASLVIKPEAESRNGQFQFAIMEDAGSRTLSGCSTSTCTSALISDLKYVYSTYESSAAYMRWNGNPVVFFFGVESLPIDWTTVKANVPGNPVFIFQNSGSFGRSYSGGGFSWVMPSDVTTSDPMSLRYLDNFYSTALTYPGKLPYATGYKGFDDSIADWSGHRYMNQQCGQTWIQSLAEIGKYYSTSNQLPAIQLVTWNDYEEGTEIETGIDNCLTVNAAMSGSALSWSVTGQENTLDHYTVFISTDGQNLMPLGDYPVTTHSLDLSSYGFASGNYTVYVKAVGKPSITNHMSPAVTYLSGTSQKQAPVARLSVTPPSGTVPLRVTADTSASTATNATITGSSINWGDGTSSAGPTASHSYPNVGSYTVTATVTDSNGLSGTATASVTVTAAPTLTPKVTVTSPLNNSTVSTQVHVVASGVAPNPIDALQIYLDGNFIYEVKSSQMDTTITAAPGTHAIAVKMWQTTGETTLQIVNVTAGDQPPVAVLNVTPLSGNGPLTVTATTSGSSDPDGSIASSSIDFGDGTVASGPTVSHTYANAGTYTVKATVKDNYAVAATASVTVTVNAPQITPKVTVTSPTNNATTTSKVHVIASGVAPNPIDAMQIYFDSTLVYQVSASSIDTTLSVAPGAHAMTVKLWQAGQATSASINFTSVDQPPVAVLSVSPLSGTAPVTVTATTAGSSDPDGSIAGSTIDFGDGTIVTGSSASHAYANAGTYTVKATLTDNYGVSSSATATVTVSSSTTTRTIVMTSPTANSTWVSNIHVAGYATSPTGINALQVYIDGSLKYQVSSSTIDTLIAAGQGKHRVTLKAWDASGSLSKQVWVTVQ
jgi:PKD repeat protein